MKLKYEQELAKCSDQPCPSRARFAPRAQVGFRWMQAEPTAHDFKPVAFSRSGKRRCEWWSLSFFSTADAAKKMWLRLYDREDVVSRRGDHIGRVDILECDGISSQPSKTKHFDLHEAADGRELWRHAGPVVAIEVDDNAT